MRRLRTPFWQTPAIGRILLAGVISLLIHLFLIGEISINLPNWESHSQAIEARLILPKPQAAIPSVAPDKVQAKPLEKTVSVSPAIESTPIPVAETVFPSIPPTEEVQPVPTEMPPPEVAVESEPPIEDTGVIVNLEAYKYVETEFDVRTDATAKVDSRPDGRAKVIYQLLPNGEQYKLESLIQPIGFASLIIPDLLQTSEGFMSNMGLQPTQYLYQFGTNKDKTYRARLDWESAKLHLNTSKGAKELPLVPGTQDMLSFMYQFMFIPPPQNMQLMITNGKKLDSYQYFFEGEETIDTRNGKLRTVHIYRDNDDGDERSELWLAVDYQYVPVKIRKTEQDNKVYELLATSIKTDLPPETQP